MKKIVLLFLVLIPGMTLFAQVGIGTTSPNSSSALDISSTTKGLLVPRMTTTQRNAIASPLTGLLVLNTDDQCLDIFDGTNWIKNCGLKITGTDTIAPAWTQKTNFPFNRMEDVGFSIGAKGYMGTGTQNGTRKKDFWEYDPSTNAWTQKADFGGTARSGAVGIGFNGYGYISTGLDGAFRADMWEYNPSNNTWTARSGLPGLGRTDAFCAVYQGVIVIGGGQTSSNTWLNDVRLYNPITDQWGSLPNYPWLGHSMSAFVSGGNLYAGTGYMDFSPFGAGPSNLMYIYDGGPTWLQAPAYPGGNMHSLVCGTIDGAGVMGLGKPTAAVYPANFWRFDDATSAWTALPDMPVSGRAYAASFVIGKKMYVGTGFNGAELQDFWELDLYPSGKVYAPPALPSPVAEFSDGIWKQNISTIQAVNATQLSFGVAYPQNTIDLLGGQARTGTHSTDVPFYVTGNNTTEAIAEFKQANGGAGIGIGVETIYATGTNADQNLTFKARGTGGLHFMTANQYRFQILGNGNIGVGVSGPTNKFDITSGTRSGTHSSSLPLYVTGALTDAGNGFEIKQLDGTQGIGLGRNTIYAAGSNASQNLSLASKGTTGVLAFNTNSAERVRINEIGNMGVGLSTVNNKLDVTNGTRTGTHTSGIPFYVTGALTDAGNGFEIKQLDGTQGIGIGRNTIYAAGSNADQNLSLTAKGTNGVLAFYTNTLNRMWIAANGNIGIGTSNPLAPLHVSGGTGTRKIVMWQVNNNDHEYIGFGLDGDGSLRYQTAYLTNDHVFYTAINGTSSDELMRLKSANGNLALKGIIETENYIAPALQNGFVNYGNGYCPVGYYKDKEGVVHLHGLVNIGTNPNNVTMFTLPVGYRLTTGTTIFIVLNNNATARIDIFTDGTIKVNTGAVGWFSLDGISFKANG